MVLVIPEYISLLINQSTSYSRKSIWLLERGGERDRDRDRDRQTETDRDRDQLPFVGYNNQPLLSLTYEAEGKHSVVRFGPTGMNKKGKERLCYGLIRTCTV